MNPKFKIEDSVILKSGSPKMIINKIILRRHLKPNGRTFTDDFEGEYECKWFMVESIKTDYFHENTLQSID